MNFFPELKTYLETLLPEMERIPEDRKAQLARLSAYIADRRKDGKPVYLNFICTHNSRRSHMSQIWAATAAAYYDIKDMHCFSGGTEATAFNPRAVAAMQRAGFKIENPGGDNPHYPVRFSPGGPELECFSKVYDDPFNPKTDFAAVMTCSHADENCPFIPGATRISITYEDPKVADDSPQETARYDERVKQIGFEMFYAMAGVWELGA